MWERETAIAEFWRRVAGVDGVVYTARNPKTPPTVDKLPAIQFFEFSDEVIDRKMMGGKPHYRRKLTLILETFINAETEHSSTYELGLFVQKIKKAIFSDGTSLGRACSEIQETGASRVLRPPVGDNVVGIGLIFDLQYIEDISKIT
jgi:hypothetical protein